jgi:hypothetical protein
LQIQRFLDAGVPVVHPIELLDAAINGDGIAYRSRAH